MKILIHQKTVKKAFLREEVRKLINKYLVEKGYLSQLNCIRFIHEYMTEEVAESFIGLDNYKKANPDRISDIDVSICLGHDIGGILRGDTCFLPRALSYQEYFNETK